MAKIFPEYTAGAQAVYDRLSGELDRIDTYWRRGGERAGVRFGEEEWPWTDRDAYSRYCEVLDAWQREFRPLLTCIDTPALNLYERALDGLLQMHGHPDELIWEEVSQHGPAYEEIYNRMVTTIKEYDPEAVANKGLDGIFAECTPCPVACNNWAAEYPYAPEVAFRMFHTGEKLYVRFEVGERYTMARVTEDQGCVWTDSCVEFFIAPDDGGYYNFECTCIGKLLLAYRKERPDPTPAPDRVMASIVRIPSIGTEPFEEREGDNRWTMTLEIPATALFMHRFTTWKGLSAAANLYKCGDDLSHPHFLSWQPIALPKPNFHCPEFFGQVKFN